MKSKCIFTIVLFFVLAATASAQTPWRTIDSLFQGRAYSDAYELARQNYSHALEQGDSYNLPFCGAHCPTFPLWRGLCATPCWPTYMPTCMTDSTAAVIWHSN